MRKYTLLFSIVLHAAVVGAVFATTLAVTNALPGVRRVTSFVLVRSELPAPLPPAATTRPLRTIATDPEAAPLEAPEGLRPETDLPPSDSFAMPDPSAIVAFGAAAGIAVPGEPVPPPPSAAAAPLRVGGAIRPPTRVAYVAPVYPAIARASRTSGVVILEAVIGMDGAVRDVRVLRSVALLDAAAIEAVRQWRFTPTLLNGEPTPVVMSVTVSFKLN